LKVQVLARPYPRMIGLSRYTRSLLNALDGFDIQLILVPPRNPWPVDVAHRLLVPFGFDVHAFFLTFPLSASFRKDALTHLPAQQMAALLWFHPGLHPALVTVHDIIPFLVRKDHQQSTFQHPFDLLFDRLAMAGLRRADALISVSQHTKKTIIEALSYPASKIYVVHEGVEHRLFRPVQVPEAFYRRYSLEKTSRYILYVGSDNPRKNFSRLLDAFSQLRARIPNLRLIKVASGEYSPQARQHREKIIAMGLEEAVLIFEHIPDQDLVSFYNLADLFVFPSLFEGFGLPALEAMACGTPVVCSNTASLPEVVGDAAITVDPYNVKALGESIHRVLVDENLQQHLREKGLGRAAQFSWERTARETLKVYETVFGGMN
jgi:glycosyltransferase involved in cell wall biosynthesis